MSSADVERRASRWALHPQRRGELRPGELHHHPHVINHCNPHPKGIETGRTGAARQARPAH
ncbi:hypothetical protein [Streptomyces sp. NBC_00467]|uniref:hypothetical protein n=1 Tax=Streptomyces sp. NBC_00467 TaxID=2975752 RepID=UPI002E185264